MTMTNEEWRGHQFYEFDPLAEEIQPALLNSEDIKKYIDRDCLIENINFDPDCLKPASYEMKLLGKLYDWSTTKDGRMQPRCREVCDGDKVELNRNSITYLWMKEKLLLPEYIAARFNLHIRYVHKGILLGTGPLVDPGFSGNLLIPLHNLTDNIYILKGGEGVIWIEFTKVSKNEFWLNNELERPRYLKKFPKTKDLYDPDQYFNKSRVTATGGVQSAFQRVLEMARVETRKIRHLRNIGLIGIIAAFFGIIGVYWTGYSFISQIVAMKTETKREQVDWQFDTQNRTIENIQRQILELHRLMNELRKNQDGLDTVNDTHVTPPTQMD